MSFGTFAASLTRDADPQEETILTFGPFDASGSGSGNISNATIPLFVTDREYDIEAITLRATTAGSAHYIQFRHAPSGTAIASGTTLSLVASGTANDASALTANTAITMTPIAGSNKSVPAGSLVAINGESSLATLAGLSVSIRLRTRKYRTTDSGNEFPVDATIDGKING